jgi:hypothetical protein
VGNSLIGQIFGCYCSVGNIESLCVKLYEPSQNLFLPVLEFQHSLEILCEIRGICFLFDLHIVQHPI